MTIENTIRKKASKIPSAGSTVDEKAELADMYFEATKNYEIIKASMVGCLDLNSTKKKFKTCLKNVESRVKADEIIVVSKDPDKKNLDPTGAAEIIAKAIDGFIEIFDYYHENAKEKREDIKKEIRSDIYKVVPFEELLPFKTDKIIKTKEMPSEGKKRE